MDNDDNRATALRMLDRLSAGVIDDALVTEDATWWAPGMGVVDKKTFVQIAAAAQSHFEPGASLKICGTTAEGDRVAVEAEIKAELKNGKSYRNTYHFLFLFRDGKIYHTKEYNDSAHAAEAFAGITF